MTRFQTAPALLALAAALAAPPLRAQTPAPAASRVPAALQAVRAAAPIDLDGKLDEGVWSTAPAAHDFTQQDPEEGKPATQHTEVRFAYDADALYVGARMYDTEGARGVRTQLSRRDQQSDGDYLELVFDTFHDHSGRTIFQVNPSGVKFDAGQATPNADPSWDPVWRAATRVDSLGWTAEMRIPFSQLRFPRDSVQTWGVQVWRFTQRINESSMWSFWRKNESGGPPLFGHLEGLRIAQHGRRVELLPYALTRASYVRPTEAGNPFQKRKAYDTRVGGDVKALLTSNLTLDATINPDFGQVEVDPASVNLSAFETYFDEKRPFFVEGSGLFGFGDFNCFFCSNVSSMSLFYSRRIGRAPQGAVTRDAQFVDVPGNTSILGAAKVTGRTGGGFQLGLLDAVTRSEVADAIGPDGTFTQEVEPRTNYLVARGKRVLRGGDATLGAMATSVIRSFGDDGLSRALGRHAESGGLDWDVSWSKRTYNVMGNLAVSDVSGDSAAIGRLQRSSARYFNRPDHGGLDNGLFTNRFEEGLTSLRGWGGYLRVAKQAGDVQWEASTNVRSPGFETNDLGFLSRADYVWMNANVHRNWNKPTRWYRSVGLTLGAQQQYTFERDLNDRQLHGSIGATLPSYWDVGTFFIYHPGVFDDRLTRGGPVVRRGAYQYLNASLSTDSRKSVVLSTNPSYTWAQEGPAGYELNLNARFKPASNVTVQLGPYVSRDGTGVQFVRRFADPTATDFYGQRIVFSDILQHTIAMDTRVAWTFTPTLTMELFAQPFASTGKYFRFKQYDGARTLDKTTFDAAQLTVLKSHTGRDSVFVLDPDRDPATANFTFSNPDFNFRSLRGNAVVRWEYRPGSTLFFVWQQQRSGASPFGDFALGRDARAPFREHPDNVFVIKASYWFGS
ncbi:MAG TPA: DUF5916 domain-containing protein [Longimicrobiaceae bacterium]|jgi:hypothetical protein|nr:DUF5916 domain-containing protein [Longimicrobiaceae bacterium]